MTVQITLNTDVENTKMVIKAKLLALKEDQNYITYVFQNLCDNSYIMCTRLPNWESPVININDKKKKKEKENNKFKTFYTTSSSEGSNDLMFDSNGDFIGKVVDKKDSDKNNPFWFRKYRQNNFPTKK